MQKLVGGLTMEGVDSKAQSDFGFPGIVLMEQAGTRAWQAVHAWMHPDASASDRLHLVILAGGGNNGGDALVMARLAWEQGFRNTRIVLSGSRVSTLCATQRAICRNCGIPMVESEQPDGKVPQAAAAILEKADGIIDGLTGTGLRGPLSGLGADLVKLANEQRKRGAWICSVDIPSGCSDSIPATGIRIQADITVTMGLGKYAAYHPGIRLSWGDIICVNPSFPGALLDQAEAVAYLADEHDVHLEALDNQTFKNRRGHLALFAGSVPYSGAARIAGRSAFRARAGLVTTLCDQDIHQILAAESPSVIVRPVGASGPVGASELVSFQAIAAGCGWGRGAGRSPQLKEILRSRLPTVLDADALGVYASLVAEHAMQVQDHGPLVITPHPGELKSMLETLHMPLLAQETGLASSPESFSDALRRVASALEAVVVYKSHVVWIADGRHPDHEPCIIDGMNSSLGVAGSGDSLTGIIGALLAQGFDAYQAARDGVVIHQTAGRIAREVHGWYDAETLVDSIGLACTRLERLPGDTR